MPHILIVEDEPSTSWALSEGLSDDGFTIDTFRTGEDAWQWLQHGKSDLVISDIRLPGMSGIDLARKLRRGPHAQPVILVTAYGTSDEAGALERAGIVACFAKPFLIDQLRQSVQRALTGSRSSRKPRTSRGSTS